MSGWRPSGLTLWRKFGSPVSLGGLAYMTVRRAEKRVRLGCGCEVRARDAFVQVYGSRRATTCIAHSERPVELACETAHEIPAGAAAPAASGDAGHHRRP